MEQLVIQASRIYKTASDLKTTVIDVISSHQFDSRAFRERNLTLSQAYCLLWHDSECGDVRGRQSHFELIGGASAAVIIDLVAMGKIDVEVIPKAFLGIGYQSANIKVVQDSPTDTYLDEAMLNKILEHHHKHPDSPKSVKDWLLSDISWQQPKNRCVTRILDSLVKMDILDKKEQLFRFKWPTVNPVPKDELIQQIRAVLVDGVEPDSFLQAFLILLRAVDNLFVLWHPLFRRYFSKDEYSIAKERIKTFTDKTAMSKCEVEEYELKTWDGEYARFS